MPSKEIAKKIGKDIIDDNQEGRYDVINEAFINVEADKPGGRWAYQRRNDNPCEQSELILKKALLQAEHKTKKPDDEERKRYEVVIEKKFAYQNVLDAQIR